MIVGSFFSGIGMLDYGLSLAGVEHAWFCEADPWRREILARRWPGKPVYDDVRAVGARNVERVDGIVGGFPCKGASSAGKRNGFDHPETVLWREMARAIGELRPRVVVVENVANILAIRDGAVWGEVLGDLAALGFDAVWDCVPAAAFGAPHLRDRVICIATHADIAPADPHTAAGRSRPSAGERDRIVADPDGEGRPAGRQRERARCGKPEPGRRDHVGTGSQAAANAAQDGFDEREVVNGPTARGQHLRARRDAERRGIRVEWGRYGAAIQRWEEVVGTAPEPLVRGVDDRSARRVERSRLSALGDGVQVQLGELVGRHLMSMELADISLAADAGRAAPEHGELDRCTTNDTANEPSLTIDHREERSN